MNYEKFLVMSLAEKEGLKGLYLDNDQLDEIKEALSFYLDWNVVSLREQGFSTEYKLEKIKKLESLIIEILKAKIEIRRNY